MLCRTWLEINFMANKNKLTFFLVAVGVACVVIFLFFIGEYNKDVLITQSINKQVEHSQNIFDIIKNGDINALATVLDVILQDNRFKNIYLEKDRLALFDYGQSLFNDIKEHYGITHFYFHLPEGITFVRLHNKTLFDDKVDRLTFKQAVDSKIIGSGIELGKTAFALRVVKPYYDDDKLIGYIELGQEIDHFLKILKEKTQNNYSIFVTKDAVDQATWVSIRTEHGLDSDWNKYVNLLEMDNTIKDIQNKENVLNCLNEENAQKVFDLKSEDKMIIDEISNNLSCAGFELLDAENNRIGVVLLSSDISSDSIVIKNFINDQIILVVMLLVFISLFSYFIYRKVIKEQNKFKKLFDSSNDAIMAINPPDWKYSSGNLATLKMFGVKSTKELEKLTPGVLSPERQPDGKLSSEKALEMINIAMDKGGNNFEWVHKKLNGPDIITNVSLSKIGEGKNAYLQVILRDITKEKFLFEMIKKSEEQTKNALATSERLNKLMVDRELKMIELKKEKQVLESKLIK